MSNTITISVSYQDLHDLEQDPVLSPSKLFREAMNLYRHRDEFYQVNSISDYRLALLEIMENVQRLQKEIRLRNERIDSLQDVLAQKELAERRIREAGQKNSGLAESNKSTEN